MYYNNGLKKQKQNTVKSKDIKKDRLITCMLEILTHN